MPWRLADLVAPRSPSNSHGHCARHAECGRRRPCPRAPCRPRCGARATSRTRVCPPSCRIDRDSGTSADCAWYSVRTRRAARSAGQRGGRRFVRDRRLPVIAIVAANALGRRAHPQCGIERRRWRIDRRCPTDDELRSAALDTGSPPRPQGQRRHRPPREPPDFRSAASRSAWTGQASHVDFQVFDSIESARGTTSPSTIKSRAGSSRTTRKAYRRTRGRPSATIVIKPRRSPRASYPRWKLPSSCTSSPKCAFRSRRRRYGVRLRCRLHTPPTRNRLLALAGSIGWMRRNRPQPRATCAGSAAGNNPVSDWQESGEPERNRTFNETSLETSTVGDRVVAGGASQDEAVADPCW